MKAKSLAGSLLAASLWYPPALFAHDAQDIVDPHVHHHMMMKMPETSRTMAEYTIPNISLVRDDGKSVSMPDELNDGRPVVLTFIYTSCKEVCPLVSGTLSQLQGKLGADRDRVRLVSITIDPEEDTVSKLSAYAKKYDAGPEWHHYTGTLVASIAAQQAFDAYRGSKMDHVPVIFLRRAPGESWVRIDGFATADQLLAEVRNMLAAN